VCETTGRPVIGSACYGFECVNNLGYGIVVAISTVEVVYFFWLVVVWLR
jgi:hypothetical protein